MEEEKMNKRQAKKKGKNRTMPPSIPLDKFLKRLDKMIRKPYHDCFLPWELVLKEEEIDDRK
jgi:hypothetical protein